ncbi:Serine carboxypeptidase-like 42 [Hibiscus syriacus]|uniref:Carboxypeptidase n=1 Tax=Hibiscus syriacus TaxID=106335 RepID=A0A6A2Y4V1_HIBSY|nr:Serine carboxypeptidase-like 42 [Hibiscus syriacus]
MGRWNEFGGVLLSIALLGVVVVEGYPAEDLVVKLPGQPRVGFKQYAGYVDVDVNAGRSLFYYFVEADKDPANKPLILWLNGGREMESHGGHFIIWRSPTGVALNLVLGAAYYLTSPYPITYGNRDIHLMLCCEVPLLPVGILPSNSISGPGCSSVGGGAFTELGPFYPQGDGRNLRINSMSWNKASNLLFVESPVGVGWSYSNTSLDLIRGDASTEFKYRELFLTGESYAGHYIHSWLKFYWIIMNIQLIGNPLLMLDRDVPATYEFFWSHGMISDEVGLTIMNECDFNDYTFESPHNVSQSCNDAIAEANSIVGDYINNYDVILDVCYPSIVEQELRYDVILDVCYPSIVEQELRLRKMATKISVDVDVYEP